MYCTSELKEEKAITTFKSLHVAYFIMFIVFAMQKFQESGYYVYPIELVSILFCSTSLWLKNPINIPSCLWFTMNPSI